MLLFGRRRGSPTARVIRRSMSRGENDGRTTGVGRGERGENEGPRSFFFLRFVSMKPFVSFSLSRTSVSKSRYGAADAKTVLFVNKSISLRRRTDRAPSGVERAEDTNAFARIYILLSSCREVADGPSLLFRVRGDFPSSDSRNGKYGISSSVKPFLVFAVRAYS